MRLLGRPAPTPLTLTYSALALFLALVAVLGRPLADPAPADAAAAKHRGVHHRHHPAPPPAPKGSAWSGYAFDACRAPAQAVMDRWRTASPFTGVGVYVGGVHRACSQRHLTRGWVSHQRRTGWQVLPIWVGPQASCTGYHHRIASRPGSAHRFHLARLAGVHQARQAVAAVRRLGLARGSVLFYDLEPFNSGNGRCRASALAFLESWTDELHRRGQRSGVYSTVGSGIGMLSRTGRGYARPDAVWYAWIDQRGSMPARYVSSPAFMRTHRVHQYALDRAVTFGGISMRIDWDYVSLGERRSLPPARSCGQVADRVRPVPARTGDRGSVVRVVQCLVQHRHPVKTSGHFDRATSRAVRGFQRRHGLRPTGAVDRTTWTSLLARGDTPVLHRGSGGTAVRRLQRSLDAAVRNRHVRVDGSFGRATAAVVRHYRRHLGMAGKPVVTPRVWHALSRGRVLGAPH